MIPLAFTIVMTMLPRSKHAIGLAGFSVTATFAPAIGPTIGGYFTDNYGWPWIFYVNLVPGAVMLAALWYGLPKSATQFGLLRRGRLAGYRADGHRPRRAYRPCSTTAMSMIGSARRSLSN